MASSFYNFLQVGPRRSIRQKTEWEKITWPAPTRLLFLLIWRHLQPMITMLQSANELQHWKKQKQLPHQRDCSIATDYYIQYTEKRTHVRSGRRKETVKCNCWDQFILSKQNGGRKCQNERERRNSKQRNLSRGLRCTSRQKLATTEEVVAKSSESITTISPDVEGIGVAPDAGGNNYEFIKNVHTPWILTQQQQVLPMDCPSSVGFALLFF